MIEQQAVVISCGPQRVWVEAERQSTCGQCQLKKGCGTGLLAKHVGQRFSRIAVKTDKKLRVGQQVTVMIPEHALLSGAILMYLLPLFCFFIAAIVIRWSGQSELLQIIAGLLAMSAGFLWVRNIMADKDAGVSIKITEDIK